MSRATVCWHTNGHQHVKVSREAGGYTVWRKSAAMEAALLSVTLTDSRRLRMCGVAVFGVLSMCGKRITVFNRDRSV